ATDAVFVDYKDGDGAWQVAHPKDGDRYEIEVTDDFQLEYGCDEGDHFTIELDASTVAESATWLGIQCHYVDPAPTHHVTGKMTESGRIYIKGPTFAGNDAFDFDLVVPEGRWDVAAVTADRLLIQRGVAVNADVDVGTLDPSTGVALETAPVT